MENKINYENILIDILKNLDLSKGKPTLCLHACCGPCFTLPFEILKDYFDITVIYNNSNIYPQEEFYRRKNEFIKYINDIKADIKFIDVEYDNLTYMKDLEPYKDVPEGGERCRLCFRKRLEYGFAYAQEHHFDYFGTVMSISRYKNSQDLNRIGYELESKYHPVKWLPADFKKQDGYQKSLKIVREHQMYFQEYCGCVYSYEKMKNKAKKI